MPGKFYEDLEVGMIFQHSIGRTITEADNTFFNALLLLPTLVMKRWNTPNRSFTGTRFTLRHKYSKNGLPAQNLIGVSSN